MKSFLIVFGSVFLAELGDKTQIATFLFASEKGMNKFLVFLAAASALVLTSALAVILGDFLSKYVSPNVIKTASGIVFIVLGVLVILSK